jgi:general secretion pathway protein D
LKVSLSTISGTGFAGLPTFGNREIATTIRLKDGETNMLAGLIRDEERTVLSGIPGLSDLPLIGRLFASTHRESQQTDIVLTLTPHIVRVLDLQESDLRPFRLGRDVGAPLTDVTGNAPPRDPGDDLLEPRPAPALPAAPPAPAFPQPLVGTPLPNVPIAIPAAPKKPGGGGR